MNFTEILKSIQHFHENIIAKAHYSPDWNEETITNAFLWADFCEQIYEKFAEDDQTVKNLDKQMHYLTANYTGMSYCFKNLKGSCSLLCQSFLQNPNIEQTFLRDIIQRIQPSGLNFVDVILEVSVVDNLCLELLDSLKNISISNSDRLLYSEIKAELLLDFLKDVIAQLSTEEQYESQLSFVLETLCNKQDTLNFVLHILILDDSHSEITPGIQNFIINWILIKLLDEKNGFLAEFLWKQSPLKLRRLAAKYSSFGSYYIDFLTKCASSLSLVYEDCSKFWRKRTFMNEVSFDYDEIINHFQILLSIQDELCKAIRTHLTALLEQESKISIWHDIWSHIKP
ncbi:uncharacterized protein CDAR_517431 [Caerostris darwini]|uniref:Uncharacterized protein n=1 Tax=Caerostris darwini TaxID=1538125 RepID=A0AAV4PKA9_9ARAC|nr:uncharacterized protein CDAR_517431 [Caerostris darwini]